MVRAYNDPAVLRTVAVVLLALTLALGARLALLTRKLDRADAHVLRLLDGCATSTSDREHR